MPPRLRGSVEWQTAMPLRTQRDASGRSANFADTSLARLGRGWVRAVYGLDTLGGQVVVIAVVAEAVVVALYRVFIWPEDEERQHAQGTQKDQRDQPYPR